MNNDGFGNINFLDLIYDICCNQALLGNTYVIHNPSAFNTLADSLAKRGLVSSGESIEWGDP